jgi:hypothetical protein
MKDFRNEIFAAFSQRGQPQGLSDRTTERVHTRERGVRPKNNNIIEGATDIHQSPASLKINKNMYQSTEHTVRYPTKEKHINEQGTTGRPVRLKRMPFKY